MISTIEYHFSGIIASDVVEDVAKVKPSPGERFIDWCLNHGTNTETVSIILSCFNTPGLLWRFRFFLETAFPSPSYLNHYFGPAPSDFWPLLYFR
jgi:hypothetical protein